MAAACSQLCGSSFFCATSASKTLAGRRLSGCQGRRDLDSPAPASSFTSSLSTDCHALLLRSPRAHGAATGSSDFTPRFFPLPKEESLRGAVHWRWNGNPRCSSRRECSELVQNRETTVKEVVELDESTSKGRMPALSACRCQLCGRRSLFAALVGGFAASEAAGASDVQKAEYNKIIETIHPSKGAYYEEFFARVMESGMDSYEAGVADYKRELFDKLDESVEQVLELGVGTGPNLKYYGNRPRVRKVIGVDPNLQMAKFSSSAALKAGLSESQFEFIHGVGEIIPLPDSSVDAVVCTLVLCSVSNVSSTLKEVQRVLKPGGSFLFLEHVAAPEGNLLRLWQKILDPLQQLFADGCHLTRDTLQNIQSAQFERVDAKRFNLPGLFVVGPHIAGVARTAQNDL